MPESRTIKLNNGIEMDRVGLGFWEVRGAEAEKTLASAVEAGYRRIDTAMYYHNEEDVGAGIRACGIPRKELFVASKIWYTDMCGGRQEETFYKSLEALDLDYIDLYYLHWPLGEVTESWKVLERLYEAGNIRAIGVCNFQPAHLQKLLARANVCPAVDQIESNPCFQQSQAVAFCQKEGIVPEAWGPLGKGKADTAPPSKGLKLIRIDPEIKYDISMCYRSNVRLSKAAADFVNFTKKWRILNKNIDYTMLS